MKCVRWLGAFRRQSTLTESAIWEIGNNFQEVAAEPLLFGASRLTAMVGLEIDVETSTFVFGAAVDMWTLPRSEASNRLKPHRGARPFRSWDQLAAAVVRGRKDSSGHAEAVFVKPKFLSVVVKDGLSEAVHVEVAALAAVLGLPIRVCPQAKR